SQVFCAVLSATILSLRCCPIVIQTSVSRATGGRQSATYHFGFSWGFHQQQPAVLARRQRSEHSGTTGGYILARRRFVLAGQEDLHSRFAGPYSPAALTSSEGIFPTNNSIVSASGIAWLGVTLL